MAGTEYHKINTIFARDGRGRIVEDTYATPELAYLADLRWIWTEKVDGTNIRLSYDGAPTFRGNEHAYVYGKTDDAQIPPTLLRRAIELLQQLPLETVFDQLPADGSIPVTLYGEGYGNKIGKAGSRYDPEGANFVLFDVKVGDWWLERDNVVDVGQKLGLDVVPVVGTGNLAAAVALVRNGFASQWPGVDVAEGLVVRPEIALFDRGGQRIIAKLKHRDFR